MSEPTYVYEVPPANAVLCYIDRDGHRAWFTTTPLEEQTGDDWHKRPYEHNAGGPHEMDERSLYTLYFDCDLYTPDSHDLNSRWSVDQINARAVAWLVGENDGKVVAIHAGTTAPDFISQITQTGGTVYGRVYL